MIKNNEDLLITIEGLTKRFGHKTILSNLNLKIKRGDSIVFIGHNGSGKSTLLKIIGGLIPFDQGKVLYTDKLKFSYVPERFPAMNLTARDYVKQICMVEGLSLPEIKSKSEQLFRSLFMEHMIDIPIRYLSKGSAQKVAVVQAFLSHPDILMMDEPISGQDKDSQEVFMDMVNYLNHEYGVTILCSCHEDYMVTKIAKSVYEIVDCQLHRTEKKSISQKIYCLHFTRQTHVLDNIPEVVQKSTVEIHKLNGKEIKAYVVADKINFVMRTMLNNNFILKGINNEYIL